MWSKSAQLRRAAIPAIRNGGERYLGWQSGRLETRQASSSRLGHPNIQSRPFSNSIPRASVTAVPHIAHKDESPGYWCIGNLWKVMFSGIQTDNQFAMIDQLVHNRPTGFLGGPQTHTHKTDEGMYIVNGQCTFNAGGKDGMVAPTGSFINIPRHTQHSFMVDHPNTQMLNFYLPAGFEQVIIGLSHPAPENIIPPEDYQQGPPPPLLAEKLAKIYGMTEVLGLPFRDKPSLDKMYSHDNPNQPLKPYVRNALQSSAYWYGGGLWSELASSASTGDSYDFLEVVMPKNAGPGPVIYERSDVWIYVVEGQMTFLLGDSVEIAEKGASVYLPRGTVFAYRADEDQTKFLNLHTPGGFDHVLKTYGVPAEQRTLPPQAFAEGIPGQHNPSTPGNELGLRYVSMANPLA